MANNLDAFVPEIWSTRLVQRIDRVNVALNFVNSDYEGEIRQKGDTVQVRTVGDITIGDYARGDTITAQDLTPTKETLAVNTGRYFAFDVDRMDIVQDDIPAIDVYAKRAAVSISNDVDSFIFGAYSQANAANKITGSAGAAIDISSEDPSTGIYPLLVQAGRKLDDQNVPQEGRWVVLTPYAKQLALLDTKWFIRASALGDAMVTSARFEGMTAQNTPGFIGQAAGFDVYASTALPTNSANRYILYGQGKPISYAAQIPPGYVEAQSLENSFEVRVKGLLLHGKAVFGEDSKRLGTIYVDNS